jgi:glycosyltransferase involved in cell wall biosynthesis
MLIANTKKIVFIYNEDYPWDIRVYKICHALMEAGHEVHLICNNKMERKSDECIKGLHIHRVRYFKHQFINTATFYNPIWLTIIYSVVSRIDPDLIIIRDLPLCLSGIGAATIFRIPVIFDMAENYPEAIKIWNITGEYNLINRAIRNYTLTKFIEKISVKNVDMIFAVTEESKKHLLKIGAVNDKIRIIGNTPDLSFIEANVSETQKEEIAAPYKKQYLILYVGGFQHDRGLDIAIEGMVDVSHAIPESKLLLIGDGLARADYEHLAKRLNIANHVKFLKHIDFPDIFNYIAISDLCIVPHLRSGHTDTTMPNKIFDYMAMGKPVLVSDAVPLKRLVYEENCGEFFISANPKDFAQKTIDLYRSGMLEEMGMNGKKACQKKYNWSVDKAFLLEAIEQITNSERKES